MNEIIDSYCDILEGELVTALGCTEPISLAYAAAVGRETLGAFPNKIKVFCSGNLIKNAMGVLVPNSKGMKGIKAAVILGALSGQPELLLEVLTPIQNQDIEQAQVLEKAKDFCSVASLETPHTLHLQVFMEQGADKVMVEIVGSHTNLVTLKKNGAFLIEKEKPAPLKDSSAHAGNKLNLADILWFAENVPLDRVSSLLEQQISYNSKIAAEGLAKEYGVNVGSTLLHLYGDEIEVRAKAKAAAASDARMSGCDLPVVINSGSGNQGIAASVPVIEYAKELGSTKDELYRALIISNLLSIQQRSSVGRLSAYCGAVSAACGSGAAITYLHGGGTEEINNTINNTLGTVAGIVCDGAKPSCAAKIASAVDAALMSHGLSMEKRTFSAGDGIVKKTADQTIDSVGRMAKDGMRETDLEIIKIMTE